MRTWWLAVATVATVVACSGKKAGPSDKAKDKPAAPGTSTDYVSQSKATEAVQGIHHIHEGARSYYQEERVSPSGETMPPQFPASEALTPPRGTCCKSGGQCPVTASWWETPGWKALMFDRVDPHYYSYAFISSGTGDDAKFTARAVGDLDCDGIYATFELTGTVQSGDHEVAKPGPLFKVNELE